MYVCMYVRMGGKISQCSSSKINTILWVCLCSYLFIHDFMLTLHRANSFAERLRLALAVIHGEAKEESEVDSRHSPPPEGGKDSIAMPVYSGGEELGGTPSRNKANLLSVVPKEKPPLNVVGDVHGKIAIIVVSCSE